MEWLQAFMIAGSTIGACYIMHRENKETSKELNELAKDFNKESREFHGRLCAI